MKLKSIILPFLIISFIIMQAHASAETPRDLFEKGSGFLNQGKYDLAIDSFSKALDLGIKDEYHQAVTYYNRGLAYSRKGETEKAIFDYCKTIALYQDYQDAYLNRGNEYLFKGDYEKAINDFSQDISRRPDSVLAYNSRALAYNELKKYDKAISDLNTVIRLKKDYYKAYRNRANVYRNMGMADMAMKDISTALEINPHDARSYELRSEFYYKEKNFKMALSDLYAALKYNPEKYDYCNNIAWIMATCPDKDVRNGEKAVLMAKKAVGISKNPKTMDTLAAAYAENGNFAEAVKADETAITLIAEDSDPQLLLRIKKRLESYHAGIPWREE